MPDRGEAFRTARQRAGITQVAVAKALSVEQAAVSKWETGRALPDLGKVVKLAALLQCGVDDLIAGIDEDYDRRAGTELDTAEVGTEPPSGHRHANRLPVSAAETIDQAVDTAARLQQIRESLLAAADGIQDLAAEIVRRHAPTSRRREPRRALADRKHR